MKEVHLEDCFIGQDLSYEEILLKNLIKSNQRIVNILEENRNLKNNLEIAKKDKEELFEKYKNIINTLKTLGLDNLEAP